MSLLGSPWISEQISSRLADRGVTVEHNLKLLNWGKPRSNRVIVIESTRPHDSDGWAAIANTGYFTGNVWAQKSPNTFFVIKSVTLRLK